MKDLILVPIVGTTNQLILILVIVDQSPRLVVELRRYIYFAGLPKNIAGGELSRDVGEGCLIRLSRKWLDLTSPMSAKPCEDKTGAN